MDDISANLITSLATKCAGKIKEVYFNTNAILFRMIKCKNIYACML